MSANKLLLLNIDKDVHLHPMSWCGFTYLRPLIWHLDPCEIKQKHYLSPSVDSKTHGSAGKGKLISKYYFQIYIPMIDFKSGPIENAMRCEV